MRKILIADSLPAMCDALERALQPDFSVMSCRDGQTAQELLCSFRPDIFVIDLSIPGVDGLQVISAARLSGRNVRILATTVCNSPYVLGRLRQMQVDQLCVKPCRIESLICSVRQMALQDPNTSWQPELETDNILLSLGFRMGYGMYANTHKAVMLKYRGGVGSLMKELYPSIAQSVRGNAQQVEKSIRDAIHRAHQKGNMAVWRMFFGDGVQTRCPSNEAFITRIAHILKRQEQESTSREEEIPVQKNA